MHYYSFNVADYRKDASYLKPVEHYIYRWLIDEYYLQEKPIENDTARLMRKMVLPCENESDLEFVLNEFFVLKNKHWHHMRIDSEIGKYQEKSEKAKASANARWGKLSCKGNAIAMRSHSDGNANHKPITNNHSSKAKSKRFVPPLLSDVVEYAKTRKANTELAKKFFDYFEAGNWMDAKGNKVKNWKQKFITWQSYDKSNNLPQPVNASSHKSVEENRKDAEKTELAIAQKAGFDNVEDYNNFLFEKNMASLGKKTPH